MNRKNTNDNFDKEFSLKKKKTAAPTRSRIPSWIMIALGAAVMGAVVIARQPGTARTNSGTLAAMNVQNVQTVAGENASYSGDPMADPSELEARFVAHGNESRDALIVPVLPIGSDQPINMELEALNVDDKGAVVQSDSSANSAILWVDDQPYAVSIAQVETSDEETDSPVTSVVSVGDQKYQVRLEKLSGMSSLLQPLSGSSNVVKIDNQSYKLYMDPVSETEAAAITEAEEKSAEETAKAAEVSADADPFVWDAPLIEADESTEKSVTLNDNGVAWLNGKPYIVTVQPSSGGSSDAANSAVFDVDGVPYEIQLTEADPETVSADEDEKAVVWVNNTPLTVSLEADDSKSDGSFDIVLNPLSDLERAAIYAVNEIESAAAEPETAVEPETTETEEPRESNWFVNVFQSIFGGTPTEVPTPQVTVIAVSPTPTVLQPTATPIVVRVAATAAPQTPVRLDGKSADASGLQTKSGDLDDAPLWDDEPAASLVRPTSTPNVASSVLARPTAVPPTPTKTGPERLDVVMLDPDVDEPSANAPASQSQLTTQPTPQELPHTGMADSWNIPSMMVMLAGLLLVIIGVRRLRAK